MIPLVENAGVAKTSDETIERVSAIYRGLGKKTIRLHKEIPGHIANRLQAALFREVVHLIAEGGNGAPQATPMRLCHGGLACAAGSWDRVFSNGIGTPWLTPDVRATIIKGVHDEVQSCSIQDLGNRRDAVLMGLLRLHDAQ